MTKNTGKGVSFTWAFARMKQAIDAGYYLEAVAIAESVISDRILSYVRARGSKRSVNNATVKAVGDELLAKADGDPETANLAQEVCEWGKRRNQVLHGIAKSEPGTQTMPIDAFMLLARDTAIEGRRLARTVADWHKKRKRLDLRRRADARTHDE